MKVQECFFIILENYLYLRIDDVIYNNKKCK